MDKSPYRHLYKQRTKYRDNKSKMQGVPRYFKLLLGAVVVVLVMFFVLSGNEHVFERSPTTTTPNTAVQPNANVNTPIEHINQDAKIDVPKEEVKADTQKAQADTQKAQTKPQASSADCTKYVIMIDAGSSGSRVHVYSFDMCSGQDAKLLDEKFEMLSPGLSSYADDPEAAARSLDPLMKVAMDSVPKEQRKCTPVAVKATAGLRVTGEEKSAKILAAVRSHLEKDYPFAVVEGVEGVGIMPGRDEGVYAWITANYLLDNLGQASSKTAAVFDLGGGSTQIVFEPLNKDRKDLVSEVKKEKEGDEIDDHFYKFTYGGKQFELYQHSHLLYGLNEAANQINGLILKRHLEKEAKTTSSSSLEASKLPKNLTNPCLPPGTIKKDRVIKLDGKEYKIDMVAPAEHSELQCRALAEYILNKDVDCHKEPCSFNGIHQPSLVDSFLPSNDMYIFSFFYDRTQPLGMPSSFTLDELKDLTSKVCRGQDSYSSFNAFPEAITQLKENPEWCLDLNFMVALLHTGYDIPGHREVKIAKKIKGKELGWCLGASLPLLEGNGWKCRLETEQL